VAFASVSSTVDLVALEEEVLARWARDDIFAESMRRREGAPEWVFYEGPPTANGRPGIHHVWARLFKDLFPRFHTMRGRYVARKGGWDCHGLPVEVEVEKELGFSGKPEIEAYGIAAFNERCRESVHRYVDEFEALTTRIGMWIDTQDAYWTLTNDYIESVWWLFRQMWDRGLVYEGSKVVPYCGRCGTALSSHELGQPGAYRDVTEPSVYVRFPLRDDDADLLVWTTTPWTLVSNVAVAVGPAVEYVRARGTDGGRDVILASARVEAALGPDAAVIGPVPVADLVGRHYDRPFELLAIEADAARVVSADFVATDEGSGIVHLAPAFGEIDREVADAEGLPTLNPVGPAARFDDTLPAPHAGAFVKDADPALIDALRESGRLLLTVDHTHSYPHCWRCGTPLVYWAKPTWFAATSARKDALLRENERIGWHPEHIKHGRFGDWLEHNVDWALSRDRFWGTPLPVWRCDGCGCDTCVGSLAELRNLSGQALSDLDLHRPFVDEVTITCPGCGEAGCRRIEPVLDAWFDSGSMPSAQLHHPFEHADTFARRFPADFICEAIDQTRGWFYSLLAVNTLVFDRTPYRNVVCLALVVDKDGQKMSKSKGNVIDPWSVLTTRGADALRWHFLSAGSPWVDRRVDIDAIDESTRRFLLTLWNTYSFFVTYANASGWTRPGTGAGARAPSRHLLDRWARSRLHATVREVTVALDSFDSLRGAQALDRFLDDLSNWYVRRSRSRFWATSDPDAYTTLHECLIVTTQLLAPYCPFVTDEIHRNLTGDAAGSVHLTDWPAVDADAVDPALDDEIERTRVVVSLGLAARNNARLKVRQPLVRALVVLPDRHDLDPAMLREVADALNVRQVDLVASIEGLIRYEAVPNFRALGPRAGARVPEVAAALAAVDGASVRHALQTDGHLVVTLPSGPFELGPDDVEVRAASHDELALAQENGFAVALDTSLDDGLRAEGTAREIARALNEARKTAGLDIVDRVRVALQASGSVARAAREHGEWIAGEILAIGWHVEDVDDTPRDGRDAGRSDMRDASRFEILVDGQPVTVRMERAEADEPS